MTFPRPQDAMRATLAIVLMTAFGAALVALFLLVIPEGNRETLTYMLGQLSGMVTTALAFYFATSKSSSDKNSILAEAMESPSKVEVVNSPFDPVPTTTDITEPTYGRAEGE